jgi:hypothetical protein
VSEWEREGEEVVRRKEKEKERRCWLECEGGGE